MPRRHAHLLTNPAWLLALACAGCGAANQRGEDAGAQADGGWRTLFNGSDFTGWDRYLGAPADGGPPLGLDDDPRGVYSIAEVDGAPAIHISGEVWGALISQEEFGHFDLRAEYKWGARTWPPLGSFDSGIMYLSTGPLGAVNAGGTALSNPLGSGAFMVSMEYQISSGDIGGIYNLGPISSQPLQRTVVPDLPGAWNQVEIVFSAGSAEHYLNGQQVAGASGFVLTWPGRQPAPLASGKLQLQSEGGEIYFRHLELLPLP